MPYTLLLADDSVTIQRVIELTFADEDVTVVAVSDGDQAIERLDASPPDIVLADIGMPGKNGYEVAQYIRRSPHLAHIPVVLLTGAFEPVDQARANEAGCDGVLAKPFEPQLVISRVKELLARPQHTPDASGSLRKDAGAVEGGAPVPDAPSLVSPAAHDSRAFSAPKAEPVTPAPTSATSQTPGGAAPHRDLNDYFDQLDAAFSKIPPAEAKPSAQLVAESASQPASAPADDLDWYRPAVNDGGDDVPWDLPAPPADVAPEDVLMTYASPQPETPFAPILEAAPSVEPARVSGPDERLAPIEESAAVEFGESSAPTVEPAATVASISAPASFAKPAPVAPLLEGAPLPPLADAFAALLAAEQGEPLPTGALWPQAPPPAPPPVVVSEEVIEMITRRVLDSLSDTVVRQAVSDIASTVAERLIREEIERIKATIK